MRRPVWLWIVIALYALAGLTNLRTAIHAALGTEAGVMATQTRGVLIATALVSGLAGCATAYWSLRGDARAIAASLVFLAAFIAIALWSTAIMGFTTRWGFLLGWAALFSAMSGFLGVARQRGHLA